ncbi:glutaredoxin [Bacillus phage KonjoTrouble]|uniref:Glutaredoxin n=5 Tax=Claudivirus TaxID=2842609 RepID=A0A514AAJ8_9CAUD|nr:glutaredoxin [Bacillus phage Claudi]YP_009910213.1 glutaredoxin [Bacillus phage SerPounce]YP_009910291.1 glutaredoxin [Bacillus phage KonjoTrouble]YP_010114373.1 thioredoxin domain [Bacillus phage Thornton]QDH50286.1 glutaredoxin [Bacillus phage VioletteMad]ANT41158.1 glutaredoxin [Bacillus phage Claudi]ARQ95539.1 glutaredoxin [Bacillus phage SerPounce]ASU04127.1 glutaredoxin [Bacillus phage KonjoTrouble]QQM14995.1 glutaredoxin [Bacillus phage Thornton]
MNIIMYTKNNCPNCMRAEFMFSACPTPVNIEKRNVDENESHKSYLTEVFDSNTLPTFVYESDVLEFGEWKKKINVLRGFDENLGKLQEVLGL